MTTSEGIKKSEKELENSLRLLELVAVEQRNDELMVLLKRFN